jgi:hypothetical protein
VKRELIRSPTFVRAARKFVKKRPAAATDIRDALNLLAEDALIIGCVLIN